MANFVELSTKTHSYTSQDTCIVSMLGYAVKDSKATLRPSLRTMLEIMEIQRDGMYKSVKALSNFKFHN